VIKKFKPLWSFKIKQTESWLSEMSSRGYHLSKANLAAGVFYFEPGEPQNRIYRIASIPGKTGFLPQNLVDEGWQSVFYKGNWCILANTNPKEKIKSYPTREGLSRRNKIILIIMGGILFYQVFSKQAGKAVCKTGLQRDKDKNKRGWG